MGNFARALHHLDMKDVKRRHLKELAVRKIKEEQDKKEEKIIQEIAKKHKSDWRKELEENFTVVSNGPTNSATQTFQHVSGQNFSFSGIGGQEGHPSTVTVAGETVPAPNYNQLALAGYVKPLGNVLKRKELEDTNSKLDASQEFAQKVGADVMMNARVDSKKTDEYYENRQKSGYYREKLGPIHGAMTDLPELKMNERLVQENEREYEIYKKNEATRAKHQKVIDEKIKPHLDQINSGLDKKIDLRTLYQRGAVANDDGTRGLMIRRETTSAMGLSITKTVITTYRGKNISTVGSVANREKLGITGQGKMTKVAEIKDPRLLEYKMPEDLQKWQAQAIDPRGAITRSAGSVLAKAGNVESAFNLVNYYIDNHVMGMYNQNFDRNKRHNVTNLYSNNTKDILRKGMDDMKSEIDGLVKLFGDDKAGLQKAVQDKVDNFFAYGGVGASTRDIYNSLGNAVGFDVDYYKQTGNYRLNSTYKFTSTLDMGIRGRLSFLSGAAQKYVSGQLYGETMMAVQNPMQFQVDIESGKQYSSEPSKTEPVSKQPTTKEPSKAVKRIKSMSKTRNQSLSLDEPIVRRKKKRG